MTRGLKKSKYFSLLVFFFREEIQLPIQYEHLPNLNRQFPRVLCVYNEVDDPYFELYLDQLNNRVVVLRQHQ